MLYFIEMTLPLTDDTLEVMHSASKHDSIHMCEILCEPLSSKCSADKSLTWIFYSWRPSRNGYHFRNSPCANTSCSVSLVPCVLGRCHQRSFCQPLRHISWLFLQSKMFWAHLQVGMGLHCCFLKKNIFNYYYFCHPFLWKQRVSHRRAAIDTRKWKESQILTARWNPIESGENQGLIWSKCPQVQTIWQPESDGFTKTIIHHFSPVSNQLEGLLWAAAPLHTMFDTLMDNGETLPPYGKKISHDLESFLLLFFSFQTLTKWLGKHAVDARQSQHRLARRQSLNLRILYHQ